jgi:2-polyprenyl-6-methoxyphenol hydroxylase-like FAD-dependent oxidoreductase
MSGVLDVLVVGAGPVGLATALDVVAHGGTARVVDRRSLPHRPSRAMMLHPRTLEVLRPFGVTDALLERGDTSPGADIHVGYRIVPARLGEVGLPGTAFPHLTMIRQLDVEAVLITELARRGTDVEWDTELVALADAAGDHVHATVRAAGAAREDRARFVAGCDGSMSTVRRLLGIPWPGRYYPVEVVLADVDLHGSVQPGRMQVAVGAEGLVFVFALGEEAPWRILATQPRHDASNLADAPVAVSELQTLVERAGLGATVEHVAWSSRIALQHRLARRFGTGRVFLAGDAAHTQSPAAAQGMNSGIQDATNLGWKLAFAARAGLGPDSPLLTSYAAERRPVARQVLAMTDAVFAAEASTALGPRLLRGRVLPVVAPLMPLALRTPLVMPTVLRILSQRWVRYRSSPLSVDTARGGPGPRAGDQLRDASVGCDGRPARLHELTARPGVHLLLARDASSGVPRGDALVTCHRITSRPGRSVVAVRPDGHVGLRSPDGTGLADWLALLGLGSGGGHVVTSHRT